MKHKYKFTLFTPCYNSSKYIHRVFQSIDNFTYRDFEFIVVNDASKDNTDELVRDYLSKSNIPNKYLNREKNAGVYENIKWAVSHAEGEFLLIMGHDDEWIPETLEIYKEMLDKYDSEDIAGIGALCKTQFGDLVDFPFPKDIFIETYWNTIFYGDRLRHEMPLNYKTDVMRLYCDKCSSASNLHKMIGCDYKMIFINKIVRTYYINENPESLTRRTPKDMIHRIGLEDYLMFVNKYQYHVKRNFLLKLRFFFQYPYYACYSDKSVSGIIKPIEKFSNKLLVLFMLPIAKTISLIRG